MLLSMLLHVSMRYLVTGENNSCANVVGSNKVIIHKPPPPPPIAQEGCNEHWKINKTPTSSHKKEVCGTKGRNRLKTQPEFFIRFGESDKETTASTSTLTLKTTEPAPFDTNIDYPVSLPSYKCTGNNANKNVTHFLCTINMIWRTSQTQTALPSGRDEKVRGRSGM